MMCREIVLQHNMQLINAMYITINGPASGKYHSATGCQITAILAGIDNHCNVRRSPAISPPAMRYPPLRGLPTGIVKTISIADSID